MDLATLIGLIGAFGVVIAAMITGGQPIIFLNIPSLLIVVGGTIMVALMKFGIGDFFGAVKVAIKAFIFKIEKPEELIEVSVNLANEARKGGLLSLEGVDISNNFLKKGVQYLVDGLEPDVVRGTLKNEMNQTVARHLLGQKIFKAIGDVAPAMGMIGTLVGLVQMLSAMDDPKSIGPAMAVALLTTLYGAVIANMLAFPIADKLALRTEQEQLTKSILIDAILGIQAGQNPRIIEELLKTYLPGSKRESPEDG
ncbi:MAG: flagellar motor protein PomA [Gammaproteobacteria bacterium]